MNRVVEDLEQIQNLLLLDPEYWTKGANARNFNGTAVMPRSQDACSWCLFGAMIKVTDSDFERIRKMLGAFNDANHVSDIVEFNDSSSYTEITIALERTMEYVREAK